MHLILLARIAATLALTCGLGSAQSIDEPYTFTTLAGRSSLGSKDGIGNAALFGLPWGIAVDGANHLYVADSGNHTIRKISPSGDVTTLAGRPRLRGNSDGHGDEARFNQPVGVALDKHGHLYVADQMNHTIRKLTPSGSVTTLAGVAGMPGTVDGPPGVARFGNASDPNFQGPIGVAVDHAGNVFVADAGNHTLRKVRPDGEVTTVAGKAGSAGAKDGPGNVARFTFPTSVAVDSADNVYVADSWNHAIRKMTPGGIVTTLAGRLTHSGSADGPGQTARFYVPIGLAVDAAGNIFVGDADNKTIRKVTPDGVVTTVAGMVGVVGVTDGTGRAARFTDPFGLAVDQEGYLYLPDGTNPRIRKGYVAPRIFDAAWVRGSEITGFVFRVAGPSGRKVVIETSTDLSNWLPVWTNIFSFPAALEFRDLRAKGSKHSVYRAWLP